MSLVCYRERGRHKKHRNNTYQRLKKLTLARQMSAHYSAVGVVCILIAAALIHPVLAQSVLTSIPEIDALRKKHAGNITRKGNFDVLPDDDRLLCHIPFLGNFLFGDSPYSNPLVPGVRLFEAYAAALLGKQKQKFR